MPGIPHLEDLLREERRQVGLTTDLAHNDAHLHDDGGQTPISKVLPGQPGQTLVAVWCAGTSFSIAMDARLPPEARARVASPFAQQACAGNAQAIAAALAATPPAGLPALLSRRHSSIRMTALHFCVAGSRSMHALQPEDAQRADHLGVARLLVEAGAGLEDKDVLGMTALHHATTAVFSPASLAIADFLVARGASVNPRNRAGRTPLVELTMAAFGSPARLPALRFMLEVGCDPALADTDGISPVSLASSTGVLDRTCLELISASALRRRTNAGRTLAGGRMRLTGLQAAPHLNGAVVAVGAFDPFTARYTCTLPSGEARAIKPGNLEEEEGGAGGSCCCAQCGARSGGLSACAACLKVHYCSQTCQRAHWRAGHKGACAALRGPGERRTALLRPPSDLARREDLVMGGRSIRQWALGAAHGVGAVFVVKVQRPMVSTVLNPRAAEGLDLLVYDEGRALVLLVRRGEQPCHGALYAAMDSAGNPCRALSKVYLAVTRVREGLEFNVGSCLEMPGW
jgi:hypothetical protein